MYSRSFSKSIPASFENCSSTGATHRVVHEAVVPIHMEHGGRFDKFGYGHINLQLQLQSTERQFNGTNAHTRNAWRVLLPALTPQTSTGLFPGLIADPTSACAPSRQ